MSLSWPYTTLQPIYKCNRTIRASYNYEVQCIHKNVTGLWKTDHIVMHEINRISMF